MVIGFIGAHIPNRGDGGQVYGHLQTSGNHPVTSPPTRARGLDFSNIKQ
jgi:hypothetical protein